MDGEDARRLAEQVGTGDHQVFVDLVTHYESRLLAVLRRAGAGDEEAEDVVAETHLRAWRGLWGFDPAKGQFFSWLCTIARRVVIDRARRRRTVKFEPLSPSPEESDRQLCVSDVASPEEEALWDELQVQIHEALEELNDREKRALTLKYLDGLDYHEICKRMRLTHGALTGLLSRARQKLRRFLEAQGIASS